MILKCNYNLDIPMYINWTPKGVYRFNLFKIKPTWEVKYLKKTTTFTNNNQIPKEIARVATSYRCRSIMRQAKEYMYKKFTAIEDLKWIQQ